MTVAREEGAMRQSLLTQLDLETRGHHADADAGWLALMKADVSKANYVRQLVNVYGFEAPLESAFAYTPGLDLVIPLRDRSRSGLIAADLLGLGLAPVQVSAIPTCYEISPFSSTAEALGWMYVIERATLMHGTIRNHIASKLPEAAVSYLSAYHGISGARWRDFGAVLERFAAAPALVNEMIEAAHAGFRLQRAWLRGEQQLNVRRA